MKTITDLKPQAKNPKRVSVFLDGSYYCGLDLVTAVKYRLKAGMQIEESRLIEIQIETEYQAALDYALTFISKSVKTEKQVRDKLISKGYLGEIIDKVIDKLKEYGYVDDGDFSSRYVSTYKGVKGRLLIKNELRKKGVSDTHVQEALSSIDSQEEAAKKLAEKYLKNKEITKQNLLKCYKYLLSKGFDYDDSKSAISSFEEIIE